jgi:hypothetical protein
MSKAALNSGIVSYAACWSLRGEKPVGGRSPLRSASTISCIIRAWSSALVKNTLIPT